MDVEMVGSESVFSIGIKSSFDRTCWNDAKQRLVNIHQVSDLFFCFSRNNQKSATMNVSRGKEITGKSKMMKKNTISYLRREQ